MSMAPRFKEFQPRNGYSKEDWDVVSDNPPLTDEELASLRPFAEVFPEMAAAIKRATGKPNGPETI